MINCNLKCPEQIKDPQGGVWALSPDQTCLLAELKRMANIIKAGGLGITQPQIDSITLAIHGTTKPVAVFASTPGQQQANDIIDYGTATGCELYEKATVALKHAFDYKRVILLPSHFKSSNELRKWDGTLDRMIS